eukprot:9944422-Alexandrium_andersonii.AAC.1
MQFGCTRRAPFSRRPPQGPAHDPPPSNDGFAIIAAGVIAMVLVAVVGTAGLCMGSERAAPA